MPFQGALGLLGHEELLKLSARPVALSFVFSILITLGLFGFTFQAQVVAMQDMTGLGGTLMDVLVVIMICAEVMLLSYAFFQWFFQEACEQITFTVLKERGVVEKLHQKYGIELEVGKHLILNKVIKLMVRLSVMILLLPLNAWPVFGNFIYYSVNGVLLTGELLAAFLPGIGCNTTKLQVEFACSNLVAYAKFGGVGLLLECIPWVGMAFKLGNAYGAALMFEGLVAQGGVVSGNNGNDGSYHYL